MTAVSPVSFPTSLPLARTRQWPGLHLNQVTSIAFSSDGCLLATGDRDGVVYILNVANGAAVACIHFDSSVAATAVLWVGPSHLWVGASDGSVTKWYLKDKNVRFNQSHSALPALIPIGSANLSDGRSRVSSCTSSHSCDFG